MLISVSDYRTVTEDEATSDAKITAAITRMQSLIESYVDRRLGSQSYTETHIQTTAHPILLRQYPVTEITSATKDGTTVDATDLLINSDTGVLIHGSKLAWAKEAVIEYIAGYETCPDDIKYVLCDLVSGRLDGSLDVMGPESARALRKETVYGVSAVEYFASTAPSKLEFYPELGPYVSVLDRYKRPFEVPKF